MGTGINKFLAIVLALAAFASVPAYAKKKVAKRRPAAKVNEMGIPLKPDGSPDYSKVPNPFVVKRWTFDVGAAHGKRGDVEVNEYGLGANAYFYDWLAWRNVVYMRNNYDGSKNYGYDMSERFSYELANGVAVFGAPGFRWGGSAGNAPFVELGGTLQLGPVAIGGGARQLFTSFTRTGSQNETQFFFNLFAGAWP